VTLDEMRAMQMQVFAPFNRSRAVAGHLEDGPVVALVPESVRFPLRLSGDPFQGPKYALALTTPKGRADASARSKRAWATRKARAS
jgi:hypothetical protein